jgi:hypothetical protein
LLQIPSSPQSLPSPRPIHQDSAHGLTSRPEEVNAAFPVGLFLPTQSKPRFVDKRGRLERLPRLLSGHLGSRQLPQLLVDEWEEASCRLSVTGLGLVQKLREVSGHEVGCSLQVPKTSWKTAFGLVPTGLANQFHENRLPPAPASESCLQ